jgi:hypothetical protein
VEMRTSTLQRRVKNKFGHTLKIKTIIKIQQN